MKLGIIGLPQAGKTTIFNALTRSNQPTEAASGRMEVHNAVVDVPDERVERLSEMFNPKKTIYAKVTYADIAGLGGATDKGEVSGRLLNELTQMDGFIHVVRCFENASVPHIHETVDPARDIRLMNEEFLLNDQIMVERKMEKLVEEQNRFMGRDKTLVEREAALFNRLRDTLAGSRPLRELDLTPEEKKIMQGFGFLSLKPVMILLNLGDGQTPPQVNGAQAYSQTLDIQGRLEMDLVQLSQEDAALFMQEYGIKELGLSRIISASYDLLGLQSFFTVGDDEVRAWTVERGALAPAAAGVVHSDMEKGFIRAEVISYDDMLESGSLAEARARGTLRLEGKQYIVRDGDILSIRFTA